MSQRCLAVSRTRKVECWLIWCGGFLQRLLLLISTCIQYIPLRRENIFWPSRLAICINVYWVLKKSVPILVLSFLVSERSNLYSYNKSQRDALISQIYFWNRTLHVSDSSSVHYQESSTVRTPIHTGYADCLLASCQRNLYDIYLLLCVQC